MKISTIDIHNFKGFFDLKITDIAATAKLVVIVGPNGSGKSSLFDAFITWYSSHAGVPVNEDKKYRIRDPDVSFNPANAVTITFHNRQRPFPKNCFYFRTAYRHDADFSINQLNRIDIPYEKMRFHRMIDNDRAVSENYQRLVHNTVKGVYAEENDAKAVRDLRHELIGRIQEAMRRVFGDLMLNNISDPLEDGSFYFQKGEILSYHYKNLSGGEKAAFDLLVDMILKSSHYTDTVFCVDEPELHMHTSLQGNLLEELVNCVNADSQLWVATQSVGVITKARELSLSRAGEVCILDFSGHDFDGPCTIRPARIDKVLWEKFLSITVGELAGRIAPNKVYLCEGSLDGRRRKNFDADILNNIFQSRSDEMLFISGGSCTDLEKPDHVGSALLRQVLGGNAVVKKLIDRDDRSPQQVQDLERDGVVVLSRRNLECYLFDEEIVRKLAIAKGGDPEMMATLVQAREAAINDSVGRSNPRDDMKSAAGKFFLEIKRILNLTACGNNVDAFMRDTLAELVTEETQVFRELKRDIFGE